MNELIDAARENIQERLDAIRKNLHGFYTQEDLIATQDEADDIERQATLALAAPDLLEALRNVMHCEFNSISSRQEMVRVASAAIAKATGDAA